MILAVKFSYCKKSGGFLSSRYAFIVLFYEIPHLLPRHSLFSHLSVTRVLPPGVQVKSVKP